MTANQAYRQYMSAEGDGEKLTFAQWLQKQKDDGTLNALLNAGAGALALFGITSGQTGPGAQMPPVPPADQKPEKAKIMGMSVPMFTIVAIGTISLVGYGIYKLVQKKA